MYSLQRRLERYQINIIWKIIEGHPINVNNKINTVYNPRTGRKCSYSLPQRTGGMAWQTKHFNSFVARGPRLFNMLPPAIRNISNTSVAVFKNNLDKFLASLPDKPVLSGYASTCDNSLTSLGPRDVNGGRRGSSNADP